MHYYQHHIGDYRRDTGHLSLLEHGAYRQLMDLYYLEEQPIPNETDWVMRRLSARTEDERNAVLMVLRDFFTEGENGWTHQRCEAEIREYHHKADTNRVNGKLGGRPKKTQSVSSGIANGNPIESESNPNHEPLTINHEPSLKNTPRKRGESGYTEDFERAWGEYPGRPGNTKATAFKAWCARVKDGISPETMVEGVKRYSAYCQAMRTEPRFIKQAATFFGPDRHFESDWTANVLPATATRMVTPRSVESFRERDERLARKKYEQITGKPHPDNLREAHGGDFIEVGMPTQLLEVNQ